MRRIILFSFSIILLSSTWLMAEDEVLFEDSGLFKIQNQIYFLSDVRRMRQDLLTFHCIFEKSLLLTAVGLTQDAKEEAKESLLSSLPLLDMTNLDKNQPYLEKLINLLKVNYYVLNQEFQAKPEKLKALKEKLKKKVCGQGVSLTDDSSWSNELKNFVKDEMFFHDRFQGSSFWVSDLELNQVLKKDPKVDAELAKRMIRSKKIDEALLLFMGPLLRQISHETMIKWKK